VPMSDKVSPALSVPSWFPYSTDRTVGAVVSSVGPDAAGVITNIALPKVDRSPSVTSKLNSTGPAKPMSGKNVQVPSPLSLNEPPVLPDRFAMVSGSLSGSLNPASKSVAAMVYAASAVPVGNDALELPSGP